MEISEETGLGTSISKIAWVTAIGTAPYWSYQYLQMEVISLASGHSFQPPKGIYAGNSQGFVVGILNTIVS